MGLKFRMRLNYSLLFLLLSAEGGAAAEPEVPVRGVAPQMARWQALPLQAPAPVDNPWSEAKEQLGRKLFFDKRLSLDSTLSCASCHQLTEDKGGADGQRVSTGIDGQQGSRNAPTVLNAAFQRVLFWDGRAASLEEQALGPLTNPVEMGMPDLAAVEQRLQSLDEYRPLFAVAFPEQPVVSAQNLARAIATYERTLITPDSPYDRFVRGDRSALTEQQVRGMALFEAVGCIRCHAGVNFSEAGVSGTTSPYRVFPALAEDVYQQRYQLTADRGLLNDLPDSGIGVWRIPSLRNVSRTAPYFHNGSVNTLEEAVRVMARVQLGKSTSEHRADSDAVYWSSDERRFRSSRYLALTNTEVQELVAFLESLSGSLPDRHPSHDQQQAGQVLSRRSTF